MTIARGRTTLTGYGWKHQKARAAVKRLVDSGKATCCRCGTPISPIEKWDLDHWDHPDAKRLGWYAGPAHRGCNRDLTGRTAERRRQQPRPKALDFFDT